MRRVLADALAEQGFEVVAVACNGDEALGLCDALRPDVLTLDLAMPGLDGIGVLRALRDRGSPIPVVVVSAFSPAHGARAVDALAEGAVELVAKPAAGNRPERVLRRARRQDARWPPRRAQGRRRAAAAAPAPSAPGACTGAPAPSRRHAARWS